MFWPGDRFDRRLFCVVRYAFAPASLVSPLGCVALIANSIFGPLILNEQWRKGDLLGCALAVVGGVIVVFSSKADEKVVSFSHVLYSLAVLSFEV